MDGWKFENLCADILRKMGYENVEVTKGSGDQGVDVLAEHDKIKYAVQCKYYSEKVGNRAIQEISAGKQFYHCHVGIVMTNNYFTQSAKELAKENGIILWDGDFIGNFLNEIQEENSTVESCSEKQDILIINEKTISTMLFDYIDSTSRVAISKYFHTGDKNIYANEMIKYVKEPVLYYEAKFDPKRETIDYTYYCGIKFGFRFSNAYKYIKNLSKDSSNFTIFELGVSYDIADIFISEDGVSVKKNPIIHIMPSNIENMKILEGLDGETDSLKISQDIFVMKTGNILDSSHKKLPQDEQKVIQSELDRINNQNNTFDIFDIDEKIIRFKDEEISKAFFQYLDSISRLAIDLYLQEKNENEYTNEMNRYVEQPITLYNAKYHHSLKHIQYVYYCKIQCDFIYTSAYAKLKELAEQKGKNFNDDLFQIDVYYGIDNIFLIGKDIKLSKQPEINIETSDMETIKCLESIDEYEKSYKSYINEKSFFVKMDNIK